MSGGGLRQHSQVYVKAAQPGDADGINKAVEALFCLLPAAARLGPHSRVLIKPNLLSGSAPEKAVTTHPDVLRAVILALQSRGVADILVADSPGGPYTPGGMRGVYKACGLAPVCEETGAALYTACESEMAPAAENAVLVKQFQLLRPVLARNFIVNLPKFKTHVLTGVSGAVKNLFGCVPGLRKAEFHMRFPERADFAGMIVDLCETVKADIHIMDGVTGMEGDGPGGGNPRVCGRILAGQDPYAIDLAMCGMMGIKPMETPILAVAHARGLCPEKAGTLQGDAEVMGVIPGYAPPRSYTGRMNFAGSVPGFLRPVVNFITPRLAPRPRVLKAQCIGCGRCAEICPQKVIEIRGGKAVIHKKQCIRCFCCHEMCPAHAMDVKRSRLLGL